MLYNSKIEQVCDYINLGDYIFYENTSGLEIITDLKNHLINCQKEYPRFIAINKK